MSGLWRTEGQYKTLCSLKIWLDEMIPVKSDSLNLQYIEDEQRQEEALDQLFFDLLVPVFSALGIPENKWTEATEFVATKCAAELNENNEDKDNNDDIEYGKRN